MCSPCIPLKQQIPVCRPSSMLCGLVKYFKSEKTSKCSARSYLHTVPGCTIPGCHPTNNDLMWQRLKTPTDWNNLSHREMILTLCSAGLMKTDSTLNREQYQENPLFHNFFFFGKFIITEYWSSLSKTTFTITTSCFFLHMRKTFLCKLI